MRIALVVEAASGGAGRHVTDLACELLSMQHDVDVLYSTLRIDEQFARSISRLEERPHFRHRVFNWTHNLGRADLNGVASLTRYLRSEGPFDIVHAHSTKAGLLARVAGAYCGVPVVYTPHLLMSLNPTYGGAKRKLAGLLELGLSFLTTRLIPVSDYERAHIDKLRVPSGKVTLIRNGVDVEFYRSLKTKRDQIRARFGLLDFEVCVGFVGRLVPEKNLQELLSAFAFATGSNPPLRLLLVGDGPLRTELEDWARSLNISDRVVWCGSLDAAEALPAFDIFALSSRCESLPYVVLEAMAVGVPTVATDVGGLRELVKNEENGFLVPPGDIAGFARGLSLLAGNETLRADMGIAAANASTQFDVRVMARRIERLYLETSGVREASAACSVQSFSPNAENSVEPGGLGGTQ